jgi:hypothetical protein
MLQWTHTHTHTLGEEMATNKHMHVLIGEIAAIPMLPASLPLSYTSALTLTLNFDY